MRLLRLSFVLSVVVLALAGCRGTDVLDADQSSARNMIVAHSGQQEVPFHAVIDNAFVVVPPFPPPIINGILEGAGESNPFGPLDNFATGQIDITADPWDMMTTGRFTYRDGSELHYNTVGTSVEDPPGTATFSGDFTFTGGTGRFANATGGGTYAGTADIFAGVDHWTFDGTISGFGGPGSGDKRDRSN